jgi:hypothetical protein
MKIAFHFNEFDLKGGSKAVIKTLAAVRTANKYTCSKVFIGTLLFSQAASEASNKNGQNVLTVNKKLYTALIDEWALSQPLRWHALRSNAKEIAIDDKVFAICLETLDATTAAAVDKQLISTFSEFYLGALEVDESLGSHLGAYQLIVIGRIDGDAGVLYWDGLDEGSKMYFQQEWLKDAGFDSITFESLEGRFTIFDRDHGFEQIQRNGQSRLWLRELFDSVTDHVMPHLADGAPAIPEKLWNALHQFREMKMDEEASNVAIACRRIFESVADALFPPIETTSDSRKLGTKQYKNRLLKYLEEQQVGHTEQDLLVATMGVAAVELDNLNQLTNKGVHSDFVRMQARRCLLRTLILLDDLIAVRKKPLATQIRPDIEFFRKIAEGGTES